MTEEKKKDWGGKRAGAGRKPRVKKPALKGGHARVVEGRASRDARKRADDPILKQGSVRVLSRGAVSARDSATDSRVRVRAAQLTTGYQAAKAQFYPRGRYSSLWSYEGLDPCLKEYLRNWLVRRSIDSLAFWSTKEGYETELESTTQASQTEDEEKATIEPYQYLKDYVDQINKQVEYDENLKIAIKKCERHGHAGFEIERAPNGDPVRLISLRSEMLVPLIDSQWNLKGYQYEGKGTLSEPFYQPDEVLYFVKDDLEGDLVGLSSIEPILNECEVDHKIFAEDLPEAITVLWAGILIFLLDRAKLNNPTDADVTAIIDDFTEQIKPGHSVVTEAVWGVEVADIKPDLDKILNVADKIERRIVGNFGVPRELLNLNIEGWSRANGLSNLQAFVDGPITDIQRSFKRQVERKWYEPLIRMRMQRQGKYKLTELAGALKLWRNRRVKAQQPLPVMLKHKWREIRTSDWLELLKAVSVAFNGGTGFVGTKKAYDVMKEGSSVTWDYDKEFPDMGPTQPMMPTDMQTSTQPQDMLNPQTLPPGVNTQQTPQKGVYQCDCCGVQLTRPAARLPWGNVGPECRRHQAQFPCNAYRKGMAVDKQGARFYVQFLASRLLKDRKWKDGLRCGLCNKLMVDDDGTLLDAEYDYVPTVTPMPGDLIVCVACAQKTKVTAK